MDVYIALADEPGEVTAVFGAFSTEEKARKACEDNAGQLYWQNDRALALPGTYMVMQVTLDEAI